MEFVGFGLTCLVLFFCAGSIMTSYVDAVRTTVSSRIQAQRFRYVRNR